MNDFGYIMRPQHDGWIVAAKYSDGTIINDYSALGEDTVIAVNKYGGIVGPSGRKNYANEDKLRVVFQDKNCGQNFIDDWLIPQLLMITMSEGL